MGARTNDSFDDRFHEFIECVLAPERRSIGTSIRVVIVEKGQDEYLNIQSNISKNR